MSDPLILDLYCGAGGAAQGFDAAGFRIVGIDIDPQPYYPYEFIQANVFDDAWRDCVDLSEVAAVHASPPCQAYTTMSNRNRGDWPDLIAPTRELLQTDMELAGVPYVIENVPGAKAELIDPVILHGGMFGARYYRPRLFECSFPVTPPPAGRVDNPIGFYGKPDGRRLWTRKDGTEQRAWTWDDRHLLGMSHVTDRAHWHDVAEAIPPVYTRCIGDWLMDFLGDR